MAVQICKMAGFVYKMVIHTHKMATYMLKLASPRTHIELCFLRACACVRTFCLRSAFYLICFVILGMVFGFTVLINKIAYDYDQVSNWQYSSFDRWDGFDMAPVPEGSRFAFRHGLAAIPDASLLRERFAKGLQQRRMPEIYGEPNGEVMPKACLSFVYSPSSMCPQDEVKILVYVNSRVENFKRRQLIRETWAQQSLFNSHGLRTVFIIGLTNDDSLQFEVMEESVKHNDIIQGNFIDSYDNLTMKGLSALHWINLHCKTATFVLKIDDDMFQNTFSLMDLINTMISRNDTTDMIFCQPMERSVKRTGKYQISKEEYEFDFYPPFCGGPAYLMSRDVATRLQNISLHKPLFKLEDVHITGFLRESLGIGMKDASSAIPPHTVKVEKVFLTDKWDTVLFVHLEDDKRARYIWDSLYQQATGRAGQSTLSPMPASSAQTTGNRS